MPQKPRPPGSEVAPNLRPLFTDRKTASTHSKVPLAQATEGKLYRVRDKEWAKVWGEDLTHDEATRLKDTVVASGKSRTARIEDMGIPPPAWYHAQAATTETVPHAPSFELAGSDAVTAPTAGVLVAVPAGHELLVNGTASAVPCTVAAGDVLVALPLDPDLAAARAQAIAAVSARRPRATLPYRDTTVRPAAPRNANPPRDKTVSTDPVFVRLGAPPSSPPTPPPSPLKVATMQDGSPIPDGVLADDDVPDLVADVGGGASDADHEHAKRQVEPRSGA